MKRTIITALLIACGFVAGACDLCDLVDASCDSGNEAACAHVETCGQPPAPKKCCDLNGDGVGDFSGFGGHCDADGDGDDDGANVC